MDIEYFAKTHWKTMEDGRTKYRATITCIDGRDIGVTPWVFEDEHEARATAEKMIKLSRDEDDLLDRIDRFTNRPGLAITLKPFGEAHLVRASNGEYLGTIFNNKGQRAQLKFDLDSDIRIDRERPKQKSLFDHDECRECGHSRGCCICDREAEEMETEEDGS